jgi:hypothetical protein
MKRPDRGAKSYVEGVASSSTSVPRGRKDRGQGRSSRDRTRAIHIRCLWAGRSVPATREKHLIRSLSQSALLLPAPCHSQISRSLFPASNHISRPIPGSPCSLPSLTKRHSHSPSRISLQNPSPSDPLQIQIYFVQRVCPPNPHLLLLDGPFPSSNFMRSVFPVNCPDSRGNNTFFSTHLLHLALSPCHVSPSTSPPLVLPPTICYFCRSRSQQFVASPTSFRSTTHTHPSPLF